MEGLHYAIRGPLGGSLQQFPDYRLNMHALPVRSRLQAPRKARGMFQDTCTDYRVGKAGKILRNLEGMASK